MSEDSSAVAHAVQDPGILESLNSLAEGMAVHSAILGTYSPGDAQKIEEFLLTNDLAHQLPGDLKMVWGKFPTHEGKYNLYLLRYEQDHQAMMDGTHLDKAIEIYNEKTDQRFIDLQFDEQARSKELY